MKQHDLQKKKKIWSSLLRRTFYRVHACDGVVASNVASAQEVSGVAVERRVRLSMCHERCDEGFGSGYLIRIRVRVTAHGAICPLPVKVTF